MGAHAEREEVVGTAEVTPQPDVDAAQATLPRRHLQEHLRLVLWDDTLDHRQLETRKREWEEENSVKYDGTLWIIYNWREDRMNGRTKTCVVLLVRYALDHRQLEGSKKG